MYDGELHHRDTEAQRINRLTEKVIGACIDVHRVLGPGLLESAYEECVCYELSQARISFERQVPLPVVYKDVNLDCGYRMDIVVEDLVVLEIKAVERVIPVHEAQLLSYLKLAKKPIGLLLNFHVPLMKNGITRLRN
jgi:GxxExxY protein